MPPAGDDVIFGENVMGEKTGHLQMDSFEEMLKLLVNAGYFRAGNTGLKMFDKIIGGLCWCITASAASVDVDILFEENMALGKKVTLSETVVRSLERMKCPHPLKAHQIQGLDFAALLPIIKWAVKGVVAFRVDNARRIRDYSHHHFQKHNQWPDEMDKKSNFLHELEEKYRPRRVMKRPVELWGDLDNSSERELLQTCLLEFGCTVKMDLDMEMEDTEDARNLDGKRKKKKKTGFDMKVSDLFKLEAEKEAEAQRQESEKEKELLKVLAETADVEEKQIDKKQVGSIMMQDVDSITSAAETKLLQKTIQDREPQTKRGLEAAYVLHF